MRKSRKASAKKTPAAKKAPAAKKVPAAKKAGKKAPRDDEVTRAAAAKMKKDSADRRAANAAQQAAQQGPAAEVHGGDVPPTVERSQPRSRRVVKPRIPSDAAIITSDDERDLDPDTDAYTPPHEDGGNGTVAGAAVATASDIILA
jgi:hypothetical protein